MVVITLCYNCLVWFKTFFSRHVVFSCSTLFIVRTTFTLDRAKALFCFTYLTYKSIIDPIKKQVILLLFHTSTTLFKISQGLSQTDLIFPNSKSVLHKYIPYYIKSQANL